MYVGDALSAVEVRAQILASASEQSIADARYDKLGLMRPRLTLGLGVLGAILVLAGFAVSLPPPNRASSGRTTRMLTCVGRERLRHGAPVFSCTLSSG
jgi:hypothetical protein